MRIDNARLLDFTYTVQFLEASKLVMTTQDKLGYLLLVKPGVQRLTDLRGKTIGISTFGSQLYLTSVTLFRQAGMEPGKTSICCLQATTPRVSRVWMRENSMPHLSHLRQIFLA